jgi:two-component system cell cycle sensor histidine kinase/response regulator CckA
VVEDDPAVRSLVQRVLQGAGYAVVGAGSGPAALDAATSGARPSLLLTDMAMPGMTGPEVAGPARERWPGLPVVFMTGYFEADGAPAPYGVTLQKPFSPDELLHRVREALRGSAAQAQPP